MERPSFMKEAASLYWAFLKIALFTIGGVMAMIPQMQQVVVKDKKWLTEEEMIDCVAVSQALPGVIAVNIVTNVGMRTRGVPGAAAAVLGLITPSFVVIMLAVMLLDVIGDSRYIDGAFIGIKAAVCASILVTAVQMGKKILKSVFHWVMAVLAAVAICFFDVTAVIVVLAGAAAGILYHGFKGAKGTQAGDAKVQCGDGHREPAAKGAQHAVNLQTTEAEQGVEDAGRQTADRQQEVGK